MCREQINETDVFKTKQSALPETEMEAELWNRILDLQGCAFFTAKGLKFTYKIKGGEMFVDRKAKSITQATIFMAFRKVMELEGNVSGPKKLGTFGASYLYPIFVRIGVITYVDGEQKEDNS